MSKDFAPISRLLNILFHGIFAWSLFQLSYGWSLDQTEVFMAAVTGAQYAQVASLLIQFSPQVCLVVARLLLLRGEKRTAYILIAAALGTNGLDAFTNIITFEELWPQMSQSLYAIGRSVDFVEATKPVGQMMAFLVTWGEEAMAWTLGSMFAIIYDFLSGDLGWRVPKFFRADLPALAKAAGGDFRNAQPKQAAKHHDKGRSNVTISRQERMPGDAGEY